MKKIALLLIIGFVGFQGYSQTKNFIDKAYLETTAKVDTLVVPDRIYLSILLTEKDTKGKTSVEELERRMDTKLKSLGIDINNQLSLADVTSNFKKYFLRSKDVFKNKAYTLVVYDAQTAGKVILGLEMIDISNVYLNRTEYSKLEQLKLQLKQKAIGKAKFQAETMLKPLNQSLGKALFISDSGTHHRFSGQADGVVIRGYSTMQKENFEPIDIEFQKIRVESSVNINFEIL